MPDIDVETEAQKLLDEIEDEFPPKRCSLSVYRDVLQQLQYCLKERICQLDEEIENKQ